MLVYVLNIHKQPLMPCSPRKARILLKSGKAKVVKRTPFTIQLLFGSAGYKQPIEGRIDIGSKMVGAAAVTEKQVLYQANMTLRDDISGGTDNKPKKAGCMYNRKNNRRCRRNRLRYRKPRFLNRGSKLKKCKVCGRNAERGKSFCRPCAAQGHHNHRDIPQLIMSNHYPPSLRSKIDSHIKLVKKMTELMPVSSLLVEVAKFDIAKLKNPEISGIEYQQGPLYESNLLEYLKRKYKFTCAVCKTKFAKRWEKHHIKSRKHGGSNAPDNYALVCKKCHDQISQGLIQPKLKSQRSYKNETTVNVIKNEIVKECQKILPIETTFGYITALNRRTAGFKKEKDAHYIDAVFMGTYNPNLVPLPYFYYYLCRPRGRYQIFDANPVKFNKKHPKKTIFKNGYRFGLIEPNKVTNGFRKFDKVSWNDIEGFITSLFSNGSLAVNPSLQALDHKHRKVVSFKKVKKLETVSTMPVELIVGSK